MEKFSVRNKRRCESPVGFGHSLNDWSLSDWMTATLGELGEAANVIKKLNRLRDGVPGNGEETAESLREKLADEFADTVAYLDLMIQAAGFDPQKIRDEKFEKVSVKMGYKDVDAMRHYREFLEAEEGELIAEYNRTDEGIRCGELLEDIAVVQAEMHMLAAAISSPDYTQASVSPVTSMAAKTMAASGTVTQAIGAGSPKGG